MSEYAKFKAKMKAKNTPVNDKRFDELCEALLSSGVVEGVVMMKEPKHNAFFVTDEDLEKASAAAIEMRTLETDSGKKFAWDGRTDIEVYKGRIAIDALEDLWYSFRLGVGPFDDPSDALNRFTFRVYEALSDINTLKEVEKY